MRTDTWGTIFLCFFVFIFFVIPAQCSECQSGEKFQTSGNDRRNHDSHNGSQLSAVLSCLILSCLVSFIFSSLSFSVFFLCLRVVCVGVVWRAVLLCVVIVCVCGVRVCGGSTLPQVSLRRAGVEQLYQV